MSLATAHAFAASAASRLESIVYSSKRTMVKAALFAAALAPLAVHAVDVDAGDYVAAPAGVTVGLMYYQHAQRDALYAQGSRVAIDPGLTSDVGIARLVRYMDIGGLTAAPQVLLPFGRLSAKDSISALGSTKGVGDIILAMPVWVINDPAKKSYLGITPYLFLPTGSYKASRALNLGENRLKFNLQVGFVQALSDQWHVDLTGDVMLHGKNDEFGSARATLKQDPLYQAQGYLRYQFNAGANLYAGLSHNWGGETKVNGVASNDEARQFKASFGGSYFIAPTTQLMASFGRDIRLENGFKERARVNLRLLHVF